MRLLLSLPWAESLEGTVFSLWLQHLPFHPQSLPRIGSVAVCENHCDSSFQCFVLTPVLATQPPPILPPALEIGLGS